MAVFREVQRPLCATPLFVRKSLLSATPEEGLDCRYDASVQALQLTRAHSLMLACCSDFAVCPERCYSLCHHSVGSAWWKARIALGVTTKSAMSCCADSESPSLLTMVLTRASTPMLTRSRGKARDPSGQLNELPKKRKASQQKPASTAVQADLSSEPVTPDLSGDSR